MDKCEIKVLGTPNDILRIAVGNNFEEYSKKEFETARNLTHFQPMFHFYTP